MCQVLRGEGAARYANGHATNKLRFKSIFGKVGRLGIAQIAGEVFVTILLSRTKAHLAFGESLFDGFGELVERAADDEENIAGIDGLPLWCFTTLDLHRRLHLRHHIGWAEQVDLSLLH